jgi:hypothetical protein
LRQWPKYSSKLLANIKCDVFFSAILGPSWSQLVAHACELG